MVTAGLTARATFSAALWLPAPAQAATLEPEHLPDAHLSAEQVVDAPAQRARLQPAAWRGPASPRPPCVPATPRPL
jgi:hypothetical protein